MLDPLIPLPFGKTVTFELSGLRMLDGTDAPTASFEYGVHPMPPPVE